MTPEKPRSTAVFLALLLAAFTVFVLLVRLGDGALGGWPGALR